MQDKRQIVSFDSEGEILHLRIAKQKINILNEVVKVAQPFVKEKINITEFVKGFSHYVFTEMLKSEPEGKREHISKQEYFKLYSVPLEVFNALELQYKAIGQGLQLSENCEYFLIPDFNIYLDNEKQETVYKALEKLCKLMKYELKGLATNNEIMMAFRNLVVKDENGDLIPGVSQIKRLK